MSSSDEEIIVPDPPAVVLTTEVALQRKLTRAFIRRLPFNVVLTPRAKVKQPAGGTKFQDLTPRAPQVMTIIEQNGLSGQPKPVKTVDGVERIVEFELLGEWDASLARHDTFSYQGKDWEVIDLFFDNGYEVRALVSARG